MNQIQLEVANPVADSMVTKIEPATRPTDLDGRTIGLYWNYKPGGDIGLDRVEHALRARFPNTTFARYQGSVGASVRHLTPKDADEVAGRCDAVVGTTGD